MAQAAILFLFNEHKELDCKTILQITGLDRDIFVHVMSQLCNPKLKVLAYGGKKPVFEDHEKISVNRSFANSNIQVMLKPQKNYKKKDAKKTQEETKMMAEIEKHRETQYDAKITQIGKARKTIRFQELVSEVLNQIKIF